MTYYIIIFFLNIDKKRAHKAHTQKQTSISMGKEKTNKNPLVS